MSNGVNQDQQDLKSRKDRARSRLADGGIKDTEERIKIRKELMEIEEMEKAVIFENYKVRYGADVARRMTYSIE